MRVQIEDGGVPPRRDTSILTVNMLRNLYAPRFGATEDGDTILETHRVGDDVLRVSATDRDEKVGLL